MNEFQKWLMSQGYYRNNSDSEWLKDDEIVNGKELLIKLNEFKNLTKNTTKNHEDLDNQK